MNKKRAYTGVQEVVFLEDTHEVEAILDDALRPYDMIVDEASMHHMPTGFYCELMGHTLTFWEVNDDFVEGVLPSLNTELFPNHTLEEVQDYYRKKNHHFKKRFRQGCPNQLYLVQDEERVFPEEMVYDFLERACKVLGGHQYHSTDKSGLMPDVLAPADFKWATLPHIYQQNYDSIILDGFWEKWLR